MLVLPVLLDSSAGVFTRDDCLKLEDGGGSHKLGEGCQQRMACGIQSRCEQGG